MLLAALSVLLPGASHEAPASAMLPAGLPHLHSVATVCAPDDVLVNTRVSRDATSHELRMRLLAAGVTNTNLDATRDQLVRSVAAAIRALSALPLGAKLNNVNSIRKVLEVKGEAFPADADASTLLERLEERMEKECFVINPLRPLAQSLALEDLQAAASERMLTASGSRTELINRLVTFQRRCDRMVLPPCLGCTRDHMHILIWAFSPECIVALAFKYDGQKPTPPNTPPTQANHATLRQPRTTSLNNPRGLLRQRIFQRGPTPAAFTTPCCSCSPQRQYGLYATGELRGRLVG